MNMLSNSTLVKTPSNNQNLTLNFIACENVGIKAGEESTTSIYVFASVKRCEPKAKPEMRRVLACSEREARRQLSRDYVLSLAAKLPMASMLMGVNS